LKLFARAPGKVNLSLFVGSSRPDGRHELITLIESVSLADEIELVTRVALDDEVVCPGVEEPNIVTRALAGLRDRGWDAPRVQVTIRKRIPIAAGMGGGSADAAAVLRMAARLAPIDHDALEELAAELGSDVPSQLAPGLVLGTGAGDEIEPRAPLAAHAFVIVPLAHRLSTAAVYAEADRLGLGDNELGFAARLPDLWSSLSPGQRLPERLLVNDLERAALSLCPDIEPALAAVREAGADQAFVSGSGPTVAGIYWDPPASPADDGLARAQSAAATLAPRYPGTCSAEPVSADFGFPLFV
jgi:4-diphosphocytidyl-2-C-methyl-D-erythritol kinase